MKTIPELRHLWTGDNLRDAISRALYLAMDMHSDISLINAADEQSISKGLNNLRKKTEMIVNLLSPYGDEDEVTAQFRQEIYDLFDSEEVWGSER